MDLARRVAADANAALGPTHRPDLYRQAAHAVGVLAPEVDLKPEGVHAAGWLLQTSAGAIPMGSDRFFDGRIFDPMDTGAYLASSEPATSS